MDLTTARVLVTGGAGFIGSALAREWSERTAAWVVYDSLLPQVHGTNAVPDLPPNVELVVGDVRDPTALTAAVKALRPDLVIHLAAETGTSQSLDLPSRHTEVNVTGTAHLLEALDATDVRPERIVLTSSRAVYGEGAWEVTDGGLLHPLGRTHEMFQRGVWDFPDRRALASSVATTLPAPCNIYGATKLCQEHLVTAWATARDVGTGILRLQNVYGPGQSPTNPYTGITTIFFRIAGRSESIPVYEDGAIVRDFVYIDDVTRAIISVVRSDSNDLVDVGSGTPTTIHQAARIIARLAGAPAPRITGQFRLGDVRSASCDMTGSAWVFAGTAPIEVSVGLARLYAWMRERGFGD